MKYITIIVAFLLTCTLSGQGINFQHGSWSEIKQIADEEGKAIFIDAYTTWCGPCKRMAKNVFTDSSVGEYFNQNFINFKIDMESADGVKFGHEYPVRGYPTLMFIQPNGDVISKTMGGRSPEGLIALGESALKGFDGSSKYKEKYDAGERDFETVFNYIKALNNSGKSTQKIANEYIQSDPDISESQYYNFLIEALTYADSKIYELIFENLEGVKNEIESSRMHEKLQAALTKTADKAAEFQFEQILTDAFATYEKEFAATAAKFKPHVYMHYASQAGNPDLYLHYAEERLGNISRKDLKGKITFLGDTYGNYKASQEVKKFFLDQLEEVLSSAKDAELYTYASNLCNQFSFDSLAEKYSKEAEKKS